MLALLGWSIAAYLAVGLYMATLGPLGRDIRKQLRELGASSTRGGSQATESARSSNGRPALWQRAAFAGIVTLVAVIGWAAFLPGLRRRWEINTRPTPGVDAVPPSDGLRFHAIAGAGELLCEGCGNRQGLVAFLHGHGTDLWMEQSWQCKTCRRLVVIQTSADDGPPSCACGGQLSRDQKIVCPACASDKVQYRMELMT